MKARAERILDMTVGSPARLLARFAFPLFLGNLLQQIYNLADTAIAGHMLGDAARTVSASAGVVRATVGGAGIITLLAVTLPSVIFTLLYKLGILLSAMLARALGCENESRLLYDINSILAVLLAIQLGVSVMFIIAVALFIRIGVDV